jgi:hypothetical protein
MSEARRPKGALALSKDIERRVVEVRCSRERWIKHPEMGSMLSLVVEDLEAIFFCRTKPQKLWMKQGNSTHLSCAKDDFRTMGNHSNFVGECQNFNTTPT